MWKGRPAPSGLPIRGRLPLSLFDMRRDVCILLSTCARYERIATFTERRIASAWNPAPPLFWCGMAHPAGMPLRSDPADWMAVTADAVEDLLNRGFRFAYLILDDHPPLGRCHAVHLNETLPAFADEASSVSVSLSGFGQRRPSFGKIRSWHGWDFDHVPATQLWKFPLHPALWNLERLLAILNVLRAWLPADEHSPWAFERRGGEADAPLPDSLKLGCYRIRGSQLSADPFGASRRLPFTAMQFATDLSGFAVRRLLGEDARRRHDASIRWMFCPYAGPYPLFWSGMMVRGAVNPHLQRYLRFTWQIPLLREIESHLT